MDKWFTDILPDKDPYHNRGRDQMRNKGVRNSSACEQNEYYEDNLKAQATNTTETYSQPGFYQGIIAQGKETRYTIFGRFSFEVFRIVHCEVYNNYSLQGGAFGIYFPTEKSREERRLQISLVNYWVNFVRMTE